MRTFVPSLSPQFHRGLVTRVTFLVLAILAAYKLAGYILANDIASLGLAAMICAGAALVIAILGDWKRGLYCLLGWLLFEDLARKFLGNNMAIYFAKDFLLAVVYFSFFMAWKRKAKDIQIFRPPFFVALMIFVWFGVMQVFNPASTSIVYGALGMKLYFYYVPLMYVGYALIDSELQLRRFFFINLVFVLVIVSLGIVQSIAGPTFLNPAAIADDIRGLSTLYRISPISGVAVYRPTSVFVGTGRYSNFLILEWLLIFGFTGYLLLRNHRGRTLAFVTLMIAAAGSLLAASRGTVMWSLGSSILGGAAFLWGAPWRQGEVLRVLRTLQRAVLGIVIAVTILLFSYPDALLGRLAFYSETLDPRSPASELLHRTTDYPLRNFLAAFSYERWPYGYGIGTASLGVQYVSRFFNVRPPVGSVESGFGAIVVEMGIGGLILWLTMSAAILRSAWKAVRALRGKPYFPLAFMIFLYAFVLLLPMTFTTLNSYQDFIMNAYMWLTLGILFRLPKLALSTEFSAGAPAPARARWIP